MKTSQEARQPRSALPPEIKHQVGWKRARLLLLAPRGARAGGHRLLQKSQSWWRGWGPPERLRRGPLAWGVCRDWWGAYAHAACHGGVHTAMQGSGTPRVQSPVSEVRRPRSHCGQPRAVLGPGHLGLQSTSLHVPRAERYGSGKRRDAKPHSARRRPKEKTAVRAPRASPESHSGAPGKCGVVSRNQGTGGLSAVLAPDRAGGWWLGDEAGARHPRRGRSHRTRLRVSTLPTGSANRSRGTPRWGLQGRLEPLWGGCPWLPGVVSSSGEASGGGCGTPELFRPGPPALFLPLPA